jgi:acyl carrier protein
MRWLLEILPASWMRMFYGNINYKQEYIYMELEKFIEHFAEQFDTVDASDLQADTEFKALEEWSSLSALSVIAMIDEEYGVAVKGSDIRNAETIEDLFQTVSERGQ